MATGRQRRCRSRSQRSGELQFFGSRRQVDRCLRSERGVSPWCSTRSQAEREMSIAGSVPGVRLKVGIRALDGHCRAETIDDAEVCPKPEFAGFRVAFDVFESGIEVGVCGDGEIRQRERKSVAGGFQEGFLTRPAGKKN